MGTASVSPRNNGGGDTRYQQETSMDKVKQYWAAFIGQIAAHPFWAGVVIVALAIGGLIFMVT